jgi:hypothetical protein
VTNIDRANLLNGTLTIAAQQLPDLTAEARVIKNKTTHVYRSVMFYAKSIYSQAQYEILVPERFPTWNATPGVA